MQEAEDVMFKLSIQKDQSKQTCTKQESKQASSTSSIKHKASENTNNSFAATR
jgi:hypothetical protein